MEYKLRVSRVLVTGGGSGIGLGIAKALLAEGCKVCICGRNEDKLREARDEIADENLAIMQWDIRDVALIEEKINEAAWLCGGALDGLVNNAGVYGPEHGWGPWNETEEVWDAIWGTNLKAQIFLLRKFTTYLHDNKIRGNILSVSSIAGNKANIDSSYGGSKYALTRLVRGHALKVLQFGIVINGILPGVVPTAMSGFNKDFKSCALDRSITVEETAACALFMMSEAATACCGTMLDTSGGFFGTV